MNNPSIWNRVAPAMALASTMTGSILAGLLLGNWLDNWLVTGLGAGTGDALGGEPIFTALFAFLGLIGGAMILTRRANATFDPPPPDDSSANPSP